MKNNTFKKLMAAAMAVAMVLSMAGCSFNVSLGEAPEETSVKNPKAAGKLLLSVNPEIEIEYDDGGIVLEVEGRNDDGKEILMTKDEYVGKDCKTVANELVKRIYEAGYFENTVDGNARNIVIKVEEGKADEGFLKGVAEGVKEAVDDYSIGSKAMVVEEKDTDRKGFIGLEKAKEIVLAQLGFDEADFYDREYELDDGVYELEFSVNGIEYEYEIDARTGKVIEAEKDRDDDRYGDDNDDWDDDDRRENSKKDKITASDAKKTALAHAGLSENEVYDKEVDFDDGKYEVEFEKNGTEYEYEIDAATGKIIKAEKDYDDDWDHDDDDDDDDDRDD